MDTHKMDDTGLVFGLDIGTRNVVGTVGYRDEDEKFHVIAQYSKEHDTRSMLDGQIHDIRRVGKTIQQVKQRLEEQVEQPLTEVCIAAAGRVLKTVTTHVDYEYPEETVVSGEMIHTLELLGVEKAHNILREENDTKYRFYCVGYSVMKYFINDEVYSNLEGHKAEVIAADIIVTFLPEDVVDGLYAAVALADLEVANLTLEPIAAINVAIPEHFRMLNIALVDVGAGTSDICITKDGSIIAYGMIPYAGDEMTEVLVQHYLVDFKMAEHIKLSSTVDEEVEFEDIMSIIHRVPAEEVWELLAPVVDRLATSVAEKIIQLNGDKTVSATFVVGGGGKVHGFVERLSEELTLPQERVALRGEQVLRAVDFQQPDIEKDPLIVTPVGICLNYYEQKNNFIMVRFNGERIQLYDNNRLTIVDAALQAGFPNEYLFPRRGHAVNFTVNGKQRMIRGEIGESSIVKMNGREVNINTSLEPNCEVEIIPSTIGENAAYTIERLEEYTSSTLTFEVNQKVVTCPRFVLVNGTLQPPTYQIKEGDRIEVCSYYTVRQLAEFMDVEIDEEADILVNNRVENMSALIYENFSVDWKVLSYRTAKEDLLLPGGDAAIGVPEAQPALPAVPGADVPATDGTGEESALVTADAKKESGSVFADEDSGSALADAKRESGSALDGTAGEIAPAPSESDGASAKEGEAADDPDGQKMPEGASVPDERSGVAARETAGREESGAVAEEERDKPGEANAASEKEAEESGGAEAVTEKEAEESGGAEAVTEKEAEESGEAEAATEKEEEDATAVSGKDTDEPKEAGFVQEKKADESGEAESVPEKKADEAESVQKNTDKPEKGESEPEKKADKPEAAPEMNKIETKKDETPEKPKRAPDELGVIVNDETIVMHGKKEYVFIDVFDYIDFDLSDSRGRGIITLVNDKNAYYTQALNEGDRIVIRWEEKK